MNEWSPLNIDSIMNVFEWMNVSYVAMGNNNNNNKKCLTFPFISFGCNLTELRQNVEYSVWWQTIERSHPTTNQQTKQGNQTSKQTGLVNERVNEEKKHSTNSIRSMLKRSNFINLTHHHHHRQEVRIRWNDAPMPHSQTIEPIKYYYHFHPLNNGKKFDATTPTIDYNDMNIIINIYILKKKWQKIMAK